MVVRTCPCVGGRFLQRVIILPIIRDASPEMFGQLMFGAHGSGKCVSAELFPCIMDPSIHDGFQLPMPLMVLKSWLRVTWCQCHRWGSLCFLHYVHAVSCVGLVSRVVVGFQEHVYSCTSRSEEENILLLADIILGTPSCVDMLCFMHSTHKRIFCWFL
jgi:hypothetical protein